ncbi:MAG: rod shape-determining protein MreC [Bacteroidales bacterium]|nr:rod shape-determining protein MreC [Bacteroidales bacterium]MBN2758110.1 rod shape-determining protein MreC [Bacteroidales bacterium]HES59366.1 rod shape-determining protein MreC [Caldithrix sp.]
MNTLLKVIVRFHFLLIFIILETISLSLFISEDINKKNVVYSSANVVSGYFYNKINNWRSYFILAKENEDLRAENLKLKNDIQIIEKNKDNKSFQKSDSLQYPYIAAKVINNTVYKGKNYMTIDKGKLDGVDKDCGIIGNEGIVGVVAAVSNRYALVVSLLNERLALSAKIKKNNYFGTLKWNADDYRFAEFTEIPNHTNINIGDTVVSSGFSAIFPEGINLGVIYKVETSESNNFYDLKVKLSTDFKSIRNVYVIKNLQRKEQINLENLAEDEY